MYVHCVQCYVEEKKNLKNSKFIFKMTLNSAIRSTQDQSNIKNFLHMFFFC